MNITVTNNFETNGAPQVTTLQCARCFKELTITDTVSVQ